MHLNTPPKATSSPNTQDLYINYAESFDNVISIALFIDASIVLFVVGIFFGTSGEELNKRFEKERLRLKPRIFITNNWLFIQTL